MTLVATIFIIVFIVPFFSPLLSIFLLEQMFESKKFWEPLAAIFTDDAALQVVSKGPHYR